MTEKTLHLLRSDIDLIDEELVRLLAKRFAVTREIGKLKAREALPAVDPNREKAQQLRYEQLARASRIDPSLVAGIFRLIIEQVVHEHQA